MVILKNVSLDNKAIVTAFSKLQETYLGQDAGTRVGVFIRKLLQLEDAYKKEKENIIQKFTVKGEDGKPLMKKDEDGKIVGYEWTSESEANEAIKTLALTDNIIEVRPFLSFELKNAELTPVQWEAITPFIADPTNLHPMV
jgi:hypothetical protein